MTGQCFFRSPDNSSTVFPSMPGLPLLAFTRRSACLQFSRSQTSSIHCSVVGLSALRSANSDSVPPTEALGLSEHQDAVERLAEVLGLGVDSAQQIIAEVGPTAATFPSEKCLSSGVGACPGDNESAGVNYSHRSPKGNRHMRRVLNQTANAAVRTKGSIFEIVYRRSVPRLGHNQAIGAIA